MRIYTDESCTKADQGDYMVIGGITCSKEISKNIRKKIKNLKTKHNLNNKFEFHFSEIKPNQIKIYQELIDIFHEFYSQNRNYKCGVENQKTYREISFDSILIEHLKINHNRFSQGDAELGFFRFYYHLLKFTVKKHYKQEKKFHITIDAIRTKDPKMVPNLEKRLKESVNNLNPNPIGRLQRQDSKEELLLQITDVILGCISFRWNQKAKIAQSPQSSSRIQAKIQVYQYLEKKVNIDLIRETTPYRSFNIWKIKLS